MSNMIPRLNQRIEICSPVQTPESDATISTAYSTLLSCWAMLKPISEYVRAIRGSNAGTFGEYGKYGTATHIFTIRKNSAQLGDAFAGGFSSSFDAVIDLNPVKVDMFIFLLKGDNKGRRFKIHGLRHDERWSEFIKIEAEEQYEEGTGWGNLSL